MIRVKVSLGRHKSEFEVDVMLFGRSTLAREWLRRKSLDADGSGCAWKSIGSLPDLLTYA
jgi:hypothetical protein